MIERKDIFCEVGEVWDRVRRRKVKKGGKGFRKIGKNKRIWIIWRFEGWIGGIKRIISKKKWKRFVEKVEGREIGLGIELGRKRMEGEEKMEMIEVEKIGEKIEEKDYVECKSVEELFIDEGMKEDELKLRIDGGMFKKRGEGRCKIFRVKIERIRFKNGKGGKDIKLGIGEEFFGNGSKKDIGIKEKMMRGVESKNRKEERMGNIKEKKERK